MFSHRTGLSNKLIQALLFDDAIAALVRIRTTIRSRGATVETHAKADRFYRFPRPHDEMQISGQESKDNLSRCGLQRGLRRVIQPIPAQRPLISIKRCRDSVCMKAVLG